MLLDIPLPLFLAQANARLLGYGLRCPHTILSIPQIIDTFDLVLVPGIVPRLILLVKVNKNHIVLRITTVLFRQHFNFIFIIV